MKFTVQLVASTDDGQEKTVQEVAVLESVKWLLWYGKVDQALDRLRDLALRIDHFANTYPYPMRNADCELRN